jgi:hypothetical protein
VCRMEVGHRKNSTKNGEIVNRHGMAKTFSEFLRKHKGKGYRKIGR